MRWVVEPGLGVVTVRRSVFTGVLLAIDGAEHTEGALALAAARIPGAGHYAYALRGPHGQEAFSDAGEPTGTAGRPLLELLRRQGLERAMVVVARHFGGVKLGRPGLYRAYLEAGTAASAAARLEPPEEWLAVRLMLLYPEYQMVQHDFPALVGEALAVNFSARVEVRGRIPVPDRARLDSFVRARTPGAVVLTAGESYCDTKNPRRVLGWPEHAPQEPGG